MKNIDIVRRFFNGYTRGRAANLYIDNDKLINYNTCLAQRIAGGYIVNIDKYSRSTSAIQSKIRCYMPHDCVTFVDNIDYNTHDLSQYVAAE